MAILTSDDYPAIRAAIDSQLEAHDLPDSIIDETIYAPAADQDVLALDEDAESRTGENANRIKRAAIFFCAARLVPAVVRITSSTVQARDLSYQRKTFDPKERAAELRGLAIEEIQAVLIPDEEAPSRPTMFATAYGYRGR